MKRRLLLAACIVAVCALTSLGCSHAQVPLPKTPDTTASADSSAARGEYIVRNVAVCGSCHAEGHKNPDGPLSGGNEFTDWKLGTARATNLTSDAATGLGAWSEAEIVRAIRNGVSRNGRLIAPVMPYEWFHEMSDEDAFAVARYLKTLPPVAHEVRQSPNFVFKLGKLFLLGPKPAITATAPPRGATAAYGAYLSQRVGLCGDCHTPRGGLKDAPDRTHLFAGTAHPPKDFPENPSNLTPDEATGIGKWSEADFIHAMRTGLDPSGDHINPFMPWPELKRMSDDDLRALYLYLRTLPPTHNEVPPKAETGKS